MANTSGQAYGFMAITKIAPGQEPGVRDYLEALPQGSGQSPLAALTRTHFARFVILTRWGEQADQGDEHVMRGQYLIFTANFDKDLESYLDEVASELDADLRAATWGRCEGCPDPASGPALKRYLADQQVNSGFFVSAYPKATVAKVKASLARRTQLIEFAIANQGLAPAELQAAFAAEFGA